MTPPIQVTQRSTTLTQPPLIEGTTLPKGFGQGPAPQQAHQVVPGAGDQDQAGAPLIEYGPDPFDCPLADIDLPTTDPLDVVSGNAHPKVKLLVDAIYLNPLSKDRLAEMYKKYPRHVDLETLHKTRLNDDLARQLARKSKESVLIGDTPMRSLQWSLQFLARPLVDVVTHLVSGETPKSKYIVGKVVEALKLTAKAS